MKVHRSTPYPGDRIADVIASQCSAVTLVHLGRGGVQGDGSLDGYNQLRVNEVLSTARKLKARRPGLSIRIIWAGRCNRKQHLSGMTLPATEAGAALAYAKTQLEPGDTFTMEVEDSSTSTVENALFIAREFSIWGPLVVLTDPLHYRGGKVEFILKKVFPRRQIMFVELPDRQDITRKEVLNQLISAVATRIGIFFARKGDLIAIERSQRRLEKWLEKIFRP